MNPLALMKIMEAKNKFEQTHPRFARFLSDLMRSGVKEGEVIDITITRTDGTTVSTNMKVQDSDLELFESLKGLSLK